MGKAWPEAQNEVLREHYCLLEIGDLLKKLAAAGPPRTAQAAKIQAGRIDAKSFSTAGYTTMARVSEMTGLGTGLLFYITKKRLRMHLRGTRRDRYVSTAQFVRLMEHLQERYLEAPGPEWVTAGALVKTLGYSFDHLCYRIMVGAFGPARKFRDEWWVLRTEAEKVAEALRSGLIRLPLPDTERVQQDRLKDRQVIRKGQTA